MNRSIIRTEQVLALGILAALTACSADKSSSAGNPNIYTVIREDLPLTVKENAELQAIRETTVRSEIEGNATILFLEAEGTTVKKGDKLVELDVSSLVEKQASQEISVERARNEWEQARTAQDILEKELTTKRNQASSQLRISEMNLEKYLGAPATAASAGKNADMVRRLRDLILGPEVVAKPAEASTNGTSGHSTGPNKPAEAVAIPTKAPVVDSRVYSALLDKVVKLLEIEGDDGDPLEREMGEMANKVLQQADQIRLAMAQLKIDEDTFDHSRNLAAKFFISRNELERHEMAYQAQESRVTIAWKDLELLINYTLLAERIELEQEFENAKLELERVDASNEAERKNSEFDVGAKHKEYTVAKEQLDNHEKQIKSAVCFAPTPGIVVYARVNRDRRGGESITEGVSVRERQNIIILPDNTKMKCIVKVQEAQVDRVTIGQPAHITVEAFPNLIFTGRVTRVAPVADSGSSWGGNDKKVYTTVVELNEANEDGKLRSRMAAGVTITVGTVKNTLTVPQQAVRRDRSVNYVWKQTDSGPVAVAVKAGAHNQEKVEILEGVAEGDVVFRAPPAGQPEPRFDQPELPAGAEIPSGEIQGGNDSNGAGGQGDNRNANRGGNPRGGRGEGNRRGGRGMGKKYADMSPEELDEAKAGLDRWESMADRIEDAAVAKKFSATLSDLRKALDSNELEAAQKHSDSLRASMRSAFSGAGRGGRGGERGARRPGRDG